MAVPEAFSDLMDISSQIESAIVLDGGEVVASSLAEHERAEALASALRALARTAERVRPGVTQIEVALPEGHVFVAREGTRLIGASTAADPPSGLVLYDLRACLSGLAAEKEARDAAT